MTHALSTVSHTYQQAWQARLCVRYAYDRTTARTIPVHREHYGPLRIQKMLWPEPTGVCHTIMVHPPAGIAGGDALTLRIHVEKNAHAVLTTPGAGKWYGSDGRMAKQHTYLHVGQHACLEWLPQEAILFDHARVNASVQVQLHPDAAFIGWDILVIGRQSRHELFTQGQYTQRWSLKIGKQLVLLDQLSFVGADRLLTSVLGFNSQPVVGTLWAYLPHLTLEQQQTIQATLDHVLAMLQAPIAYTLTDALWIVRYIGQDARQAMDCFAAVRAQLRKYALGLDEHFLRIWRT